MERKIILTAIATATVLLTGQQCPSASKLLAPLS
jgi:hypothetical protein